MTVLFMLLMVLILASLKVIPGKEFAADAMAPSRTRYWKGICTLLILLSHYTGYISPGDGDAAYLVARGWMGQAIVVPFFFFSGYGMMCRIEEKGLGYLKTLPKRAFRIWALAAVSVLLMWGAQSLRGRTYDPAVILQALVCLSNIGNSTWYIFVLLCCYLLFAVSMLPACFGGKTVFRVLSAAVLTGLTVLLMLMLQRLEYEEYWYDTVLLFPVGVWMAVLRRPIGKLLRHSLLVWSASAAAMLCLFAILFSRGMLTFTAHEGWFISIALLLALISMKAVPEHPVLGFFGDHALPVYLLQRLPMITLYESGMAESMPALGCVIAIAVSAVLALAADSLTACLGTVLKRRKEKA